MYSKGKKKPRKSAVYADFGGFSVLRGKGVQPQKGKNSHPLRHQNFMMFFAHKIKILFALFLFFYVSGILKDPKMFSSQGLSFIFRDFTFCLFGILPFAL